MRGSHENRTPATKWQCNLFYSKVIARNVNTFIPLGDETNNFSLVERGTSLMDPQPHPRLHFLAEWNQCLRMSFFRSPKMWKSQGEWSGLYGGCSTVSQPNLWSLSLTGLAVWGQALSFKRMIPSDSIPGRFDFMACRSTLSHQETNHAYLLSFACLHFQCWAHTLYTMLTSRAIKKQLCGSVRFHYACLLPYRWEYRYVTTVLPALWGICFMAGVRFSFDCPL